VVGQLRRCRLQALAGADDADIRAAADAGAAATHRVHFALTERLYGRGALRAGLTAVAAADILYALGSPHLHQLLRRQRGWTVEQYRSWLDNAIAQELFG
jgi:hypothetical protein